MLGAYGLRLSGLEAGARWLLLQDSDAPRLDVAVRVSDPDRSPSYLDEQRADLRLVDGGRLRHGAGNSG